MSHTHANLYRPAGTDTAGSDSVVITPEVAGWTYSGLRVFDLAPGESRTIITGANEMAVLPLSGGCTVEVEGHKFDLEGRESVFSRVSDFAYVPMDAETRVTSQSGGEFALPMAKATRRMDPAYGPAEDVTVTVRGAGSTSRQINDFLMAGVGMADKLLAVEVLTPEGNFSSYPPHKHDVSDPDAPEVELEEVYYFRFSKDDGYGFFRQWAADGEFDITMLVRNGDIVLCPKGYHGPTIAIPGYHMYFLNVMAGPGPERIWCASDDPSHAWIKDNWDELGPDPRLPLTTYDGVV
jgi:5-deoxy-glucuronate isomerase